MNYWKVLYTAADNVGINTTEIGPKLGMSRGYIAAAKAKGASPSVSNAARFLGVCGYVLAAIPKDAIPKDAITIDGDEG